MSPTALRSILSQNRQLARNQVMLNELRSLGPTTDELAAIQRRLRVALGSNTAGTGLWGYSVPGNVDTLGDVFTNPPW